MVIKVHDRGCWPHKSARCITHVCSYYVVMESFDIGTTIYLKAVILASYDIYKTFSLNKEL